MKTTQKTHQKKVIKMVFNSMPTFLKDILASIQQKSTSRGSSSDMSKSAMSYLPEIFQSLYKLIDKFVGANLQKYRMYNMIQSRRFLTKRLGTIITEQILSHLQKVPPEVYNSFKTMRGQMSVVEIFENLIIKYLWTSEV